MDDAAIPFMRTGLMDRNKKVRELCQAALEEQLGPERDEALLQELSEESGSLREKLNGLSDWARGALTDVEGALTSMTGAVQARTAVLATWTRDLVGWARKDGHE